MCPQQGNPVGGIFCIMRDNLNYRLAISEAGLEYGYLFAQGVPPPTTTDYRDHSAKFSQSTGGEARHGYRNLTIMWDVLTPEQLRTIRQLAEDAGVSIYATIDRSDGTGDGRDWIDISGVPLIPDSQPTGPIAGSIGGLLHRNVQLVIRNISIVNEPADFS